MPDEFGIMSPVRARQGFRAAWRLMQQGKTEWSGVSLDAYLLQNGRWRHAAWNRGFAACIVVNAGVPEAVAIWILNDLNPGDWRATWIPESYFQMARHLSSNPGQLIDDEIERYQLNFFADMEEEDREVDEWADHDANALDPTCEAVGEWFDEMFSFLNCDASQLMLDEAISSWSSPAHMISGDWEGVFDRAEDHLTRLGWNVLQWIDEDELDIEVDPVARTVTFPVINAESVRGLLLLLVKVSLTSTGIECGLHGDTGQRWNAETELIACLVGRAMGVRFDEVSVATVRSELVKTGLNPSDLYEVIRESVIRRSQTLLEEMQIDVLELAE
jgi:hypothetical protein